MGALLMRTITSLRGATMTNQEVVLRLGLLFLLDWCRDACLSVPLVDAEKAVFAITYTGQPHSALAEAWLISYHEFNKHPRS